MEPHQGSVAVCWASDSRHLPLSLCVYFSRFVSHLPLMVTFFQAVCCHE